MKKIVLSAAIVLLISCNGQNPPIVNSADYNAFLVPGAISAELELASADLAFWEDRLKRHGYNNVDLIQMAYANLRLFGLTRKIIHLESGDSLLKASSALLGNHDPEILFARCQNAISLHRFPLAAAFNHAANKEGGDPYIHRLLEFDTYLELGNIAGARKSLASLSDRNTFDYLVRASKLEDHDGRSTQSIALMEAASRKIKPVNDKLYAWILASLGDMYGHAGRVEDAYQSYLAALEKDKTCLHALRGIAWIAYARDNNTYEAKKILHFIQSETPSPENWLDLAEMAAWEGDQSAKEKYAALFMKMVQEIPEGNMYNKYLVQAYIELLGDPAKALTIAEKELENRQTPGTWSWVAGAHLAMGQPEKAMLIINNYVYRRTYEPRVCYQAAMVFAANGKRKEAGELLEECLESSFELGPLTTSKIRRQLEDLRD